MKCWDGIVEVVECPGIVGAIFTPLAIIHGPPLAGTGSCRENSIARAICSAAVGVSCTNSPRGPSSVKQCSYSPRDGYGPSAGMLMPFSRFDRLCIPRARRAVRFRRDPPFDVPAIDRWIFRFLAQLDDFAEQRPGRGIVLLEFAADPREPIPSPDGAIIRLAESVDTAGEFEAPRDIFRRLVRLAKYENFCERVLAAMVRARRFSGNCRGTRYRRRLRLR